MSNNDGILTLAECVANEMDDDSDFIGTGYDGPPIVLARVLGFGRTQRMKTPAHPNLLRILIQIEYWRVRTTENITIRNLLLAIRDKLKNNQVIKDKFAGHVVFVDDPDEPTLDGITSSKPFIGIHDAGVVSPMKFSGQHEEHIQVELWIYQQRFHANMELSLVG